jgi:hypothetical protein
MQPKNSAGYAPPADGTYVEFKAPTGHKERIRFPQGYRLLEEPHIVHLIGPDEKEIACYTSQADPHKILKDIDADLQRQWELQKKAQNSTDGTFFQGRDFRLYFPPGIEIAQSQKGWYLYEKCGEKITGLNFWTTDLVNQMNSEKTPFHHLVRYAVEAYSFIKSMIDEDPEGWKKFSRIEK